MTKNRTISILFSVALIAALTIAAVPAPAYALTTSSPVVSQTTIGGQVSSFALPSVVVRVCRTIIIHRHGVTITIRRCHTVRPDNGPAQPM